MPAAPRPWQLLAEEYKRPHALSACMAEGQPEQMARDKRAVDAVSNSQYSADAAAMAAGTAVIEAKLEQPAAMLAPPLVPGSELFEEPVRMYRPFKFVVAFDNADCAGSLSEKIANAALADAVPIVW
jgi:hypothetical protein